MPTKGSRRLRSDHISDTEQRDHPAEPRRESSPSEVSARVPPRRSARLSGLSASDTQGSTLKRQRRHQGATAGVEIATEEKETHEQEQGESSLAASRGLSGTAGKSVLKTSLPENQNMATEPEVVQKELKREMKVLIQPPTEAYCQRNLDPVMTVGLRAQIDGKNVPQEDDPTRLWAVATLIDAESNDSVAPNRAFPLQGSVFTNPQPLDVPEDGSEGATPVEKTLREFQSVLVFPRITLHEAGKYKFRIVLYQQSLLGTTEGGTPIMNIDSRPFQTIIPSVLGETEFEPKKMSDEESKIKQFLESRRIEF
ncbi:MAG: hypothetical protein M1837_004016 [Sclerophora amabilis]|nr:MAG: hypothetical protein M1837_004016 [Sclerophora amabilis]